MGGKGNTKILWEMRDFLSFFTSLLAIPVTDQGNLFLKVIVPATFKH